MLVHLKRRLTFANVVALLALFVALGGSVYAASKLNGKQIKKHSIAGNRLKPDGVTGKQVKESTLGSVPSADSLAGVGPAGFASSADSKRLHFEATTAQTVTSPVLDMGSFHLDFRCSGPAAGGGDADSWELSGTSTSPTGSYDLTSVYAQPASDPPSTYLTGDRFGSTPKTLETDDVDYREVATVVLNSNSPAETITVNFTVFAADQGAENFCYFAGTANRSVG